MVYCSNCGNELKEGDKFCSSCGESPALGSTGSNKRSGPQIVVNVQKNPGVAAVLGILLGLVGIFGIGQIYAGRFLRGLLFLFLGWVFIAILFFVGISAAVVTDSFFILSLAFLLPLLFYIWQAYDAYKLSKKFNKITLETGRTPW